MTDLEAWAEAQRYFLDAYTRSIEEILTRFNRWMAFIEFAEWAGFALSMIALALLAVRVIGERKLEKGRMKDENGHEKQKGGARRSLRIHQL